MFKRQKIEDDPFDVLLKQNYGYPTNDNGDVRKLNPIPDDNDLETVCGAVYWIKQPDSEWAEKQPWFEHLTCKPFKNALAPGKPRSFSVSYQNSSKPDWIGLPRFYGLSLFGIPQKDIRSHGLLINPDIVLCDKRPLRDYQIRAKEASLKNLNEWGGATIIADCGSGKTAMALSIAHSLKRKTLVLCNRTFLMHQWKFEIAGKGWTWSDDASEVSETHNNYFKIRCENCKKKIYLIEKCLTCECGYRFIGSWATTIPPTSSWLKNANVGWLQGSDKIDVKDKDFVVASIDSISQCSYSPEMLKEFGTVIIDEMHHLGAETLSQVIPKIPAKYILGITATPDRNDGLEHLLYWLVGPTAFVYKRIPSITGISNTVKVRREMFELGNRKEIFIYGRMNFAAMINSLAEDEIRNSFLISLYEKECIHRRKTLIVTSIVNHAKLLASKLNAIAIHGGCNSSLIATAKNPETKVVIATYQFLEEGYDDPYIDTLILSLPRSKIQQIVGRCERTHEGKLKPLIFDVIDTFSVFNGMGWKRHKFYRSRGFQIE